VKTRLTEQFGIEHPIFAFSHVSAVVAAVSRAGGFGVLGALRFSPEELEQELSWIDEQTGGKPYGVNIVTPVKYEGMNISDPVALMAGLEEQIPPEHKAFVERVLSEAGIPPLAEGTEVRELLGWTAATGMPQIDVAFNHPIKLMSSALGPLPEDVIERSHAAGVPVAGLVGHVDQARAQSGAGVDIVIAQGTEAAGHTGTVASMVLWPEVVDALAPKPVLAAGGVGSGRQIAAALALGAEGVWTGSIWLTTLENDIPGPVKQKLLDAGSRDTVRTRAWTGKPARLLKTKWTDAWDDPENPDPLPMPLQFMLTAEAQHRMFSNLPNELAGMPVGQIVGRMTEERSAEEVVTRLAAEAEEAFARIREIAGETAPR
jgi:NAD(P)H-dependent flavin oxidoreductase YrpB (nitropropane dioxygenase family)